MSSLSGHLVPPSVEGRVPQAITIARADLPSSPLLPQLVALVIESFKSQRLTSSELGRLPGGAEQLLGEFGLGSWTIILADAQDVKTLYGTVTVEPRPLITTSTAEGDIGEWILDQPVPVIEGYDLSAFSTSNRFSAVADETRWIVRCLCVGDQFQKRGIAEWLMLMAQHLVVEHALQANAMGTVDPPTRRVRLLLTAIQEVNGAWFSKRGMIVYLVKTMPPGFLGAKVKLSLVDMFKLLELPPVATTAPTTEA